MDRRDRKTPGYWTLRSAYPTFCEEGDEEASDRQSAASPIPSDSIGTNGSSRSSMDSNCSQKKKQRTTRPTPAYLPNFVKQDEHYKERLFNKLNDTYFLPSDENEYAKLELSELAFIAGFGGLYPCPDLVREVLAPPPESSSDLQEHTVKEADAGDATSAGAPVKDEKRGAQKSILDLGCGTGTWAISMAREFPHARVHGVDLVPAFQVHAKSAPANSNGEGAQEEVAKEGIPDNCTFEIDDINRGLDHFANSFDLVHVRLIAIGIKNYRRFMEEVTRCLKPGGLAIFIEGDYELLAEDRMTVIPMAMEEDEIPEERRTWREELSASSETDATRATYWQQQSWAQPRNSEDNTGYVTPDHVAQDEKFISSNSLWTRGSWLQRLYHEVRYASQLLGSDMSAAGAAVDEGLWRMDLLDPDTCGAASVFTPVGPWARSVQGDYEYTAKLQYAGALMRKILLNGIRAYHPFFLRVGVSQSTLDHWTGSIDHELQSQKFHSWLRLRVAWGRRKEESSITSPAPRPAERSTPVPPTYVLDPPISLENGGELTQDQLRILSQIQRLVQQSQCQMVVYESREECLMAKEARQLTRLKEPMSHVRRIWEAKNRKEKQAAATL